MRSRKLAWFLMLGLLIALAGCGSDGNGGGMTGMPDPPPVDMDALNAAKAAAMTAYEEAKQAVADVEAHKNADMDSYDMAVAKRDEAMAANDKAQEAETVADAQKYRDMARTANMDAMRYADMVTTAAGTAADRAMAAAIAPAIADPDGDGVIVGVGQTGLLKASRPGGNPTAPTESTTFTVAPGGAVTVDFDGTATAIPTDELDKDDMTTGDTPVSIENQFMKQADAMRADLDGFAVSVHERTVDKVTDTLTVYTNVEPLKAEAYNDYFARETATADDPNVRPAVVSAVDTENGTLTLAGTFVAADHANLFGGSFFVKTPSSMDNVMSGDPGADENNPANERDGTFAGVPGKFVCGNAGGTCAVSFDADGMLTAIPSASFTFVPTSTDVEVQNVIRDTDFLTFGYWLQATEQEDGSMKYGVNTFFAGANQFAVPAALEGQATYSGKATGMYAKKTFDSRGVGAPTSSGQFTANAALTATFNQTTAAHPDGAGRLAPTLLNSITGTVGNFMDASGNSIDDAWSVNLGKANIASTGAVGPSTDDGTDRTAMTTGGGQWSGQFYGPDVTDNTSTTGVNEQTTGYPTGVAGEFNAHFSNGHVIGAFGATKE